MDTKILKSLSLKSLIDYRKLSQKMLKHMASFSVNCSFLFPKFANSVMGKKYFISRHKLKHRTFKATSYFKKSLKITTNRMGKLEEANKFLLNVAEGKIRSGNFSAHTLDFYILSNINRAISLNKAFILLLENGNSLTAISIVRLQLDNALRLNAVKVAENKDDFLDHFFDGKSINKYKQNKERFTDFYLVTRLNEEVPGALDLYNYLCDFIHFSDKHFEVTKTKPVNEEAMFRVVVGNSNVLNETERNAFYDNMINLNNTIIRISKEWINTKNVEE